MKFLIVLTIFLSFGIQACENQEFSTKTPHEKFLEAVNTADYVFLGKVIRLYHVPESPTSAPKFNGIVFEVTEKVAGNVLTHMDTEIQSLCGISPINDDSYWPQELGIEYVVSVSTIDGENYVNAIMPVNEALTILYEITARARDLEKKHLQNQ